jgi:hypothetical protein
VHVNRERVSLPGRGSSEVRSMGSSGACSR